MFAELLGLVWGFVTSRGAIPILDDEYFMVLFGIGCDVAVRLWCVLIMV